MFRTDPFQEPTPTPFKNRPDPFQEPTPFNDEISKYSRAWNHVGYQAHARLADLLELRLGQSLTESQLRGFLRFYGSILNLHGDYYHLLLKYFDGGTGIAKPELIAFLDQFGDTAAYRLTRTSATRWVSPAGLVYDTAPILDGHRILHVLHHTVPDGPGHSVFAVARHELFPMLDEAWLKNVPAHPNDPPRFEIDMSPRVIGTQGETIIRLVVNPTTKEVITAHPLAVRSY